MYSKIAKVSTSLFLCAIALGVKEKKRMSFIVNLLKRYANKHCNITWLSLKGKKKKHKRSYLKATML